MLELGRQEQPNNFPRHPFQGVEQRDLQDLVVHRVGDPESRGYRRASQCSTDSQLCLERVFLPWAQQQSTVCLHSTK